MVDRVNDSAIFWLPRRAPIIVNAYFDGLTISNGIRPGEEAVLADAGRLAAGGLTG